MVRAKEKGVGTNRSAVEVVQAGCVESLTALKRLHAQAIRFQPESIHQLRVGTRRLRAMLNIFAALLDKEWATGLESELRWLAHLLGSVRDLDVLRKALRDCVKDENAAVQLSARSIDRQLAERHREAKTAMKEGLKSERYEGLVARLKEGELAPQSTLEAQAPALEALLPKMEHAWKKLLRSADKLRHSDEPAKFHRVRKAGKRIRYAAEMIERDFDPKHRRDAAKFIKKMKKLQDTLGELQDATIAVFTVELLLERKLEKPNSYERIIEIQKKLQKKARQQFPNVWNAAKNVGSEKWIRA